MSNLDAVWMRVRALESTLAMPIVSSASIPRGVRMWRPEATRIFNVLRPQPSGIRLRDAVAWAREIIDRYGQVSDSSNNAHSVD